MREYAARRGWAIAMQVKEVGSGALQRQRREKLIEAARRREIDVVLVWRPDRWRRPVTDLLATLQELEHLGVGFVSLTEALDLTMPAGRAMAALLAVFAEFEREALRERVRAWTCPCAAERQTSGQTHYRRLACRPSPQAPWLRPQQIRNRRPSQHRPPSVRVSMPRSDVREIIATRQARSTRKHVEHCPRWNHTHNVDVKTYLPPSARAENGSRWSFHPGPQPHRVSLCIREFDRAIPEIAFLPTRDRSSFARFQNDIVLHPVRSEPSVPIHNDELLSS